MQKNLAKRSYRHWLALWAVGSALFPVASAAVFADGAAPHAQTAPSEYETFMSHGKGISCAVYDSAAYDSQEAQATIIFLQGADASDLPLGRQQARFFAEHGFRVLLPDYLEVTPSSDETVANYKRWAQVVEDIVADLRAHALPRSSKIGLAGQALGATVALVAGSQKADVQAIVEWSGLLPNQFFSLVQGMPPLLVLHGEADTQIPVFNARQLIRLCKLKDFACEEGVYPSEGHASGSQAMEEANQRVLAFFQTYLR